jgi:hypothetical protein
VAVQKSQPVVTIADEVHRTLKSVAVRQRLTMQNLANQVLTDWLRTKGYPVGSPESDKKETTAA